MRASSSSDTPSRLPVAENPAETAAPEPRLHGAAAPGSRGGGHGALPLPLSGEGGTDLVTSCYVRHTAICHFCCRNGLCYGSLSKGRAGQNNEQELSKVDSVKLQLRVPSYLAGRSSLGAFPWFVPLNLWWFHCNTHSFIQLRACMLCGRKGAACIRVLGVRLRADGAGAPQQSGEGHKCDERDFSFRFAVGGAAVSYESSRKSQITWPSILGRSPIKATETGLVLCTACRYLEWMGVTCDTKKHERKVRS
jgi:hypothetical protein